MDHARRPEVSHAHLLRQQFGSSSPLLLETDSGYDSGHLLKQTFDSGLDLTYESSPSLLSSDGRSPMKSYAGLLVQETSVGEGLVETLERMNLAMIEEVDGAGALRAAPRPAVPEQQFEDSELYRQDEDGDTPLHLAIIQPDLPLALFLISSTLDPSYLNLQNRPHWHTPLHLAVIMNQPDIIRALVQRGASMHTRDSDGNTPLHIACTGGLLECTKWLVQGGLGAGGQAGLEPMDMSTKNYEGQTCLHLAQASTSPRKLEVISYLLSAACRVDVNMQEGKCGYTVLHQAIRARDIPTLDLLLLHPQLSVNACCYNGSTPLALASSLCLSTVAQALTRRGAVESAWGSDGRDSASESEDDQMDEFNDLTIAGQCHNLH